MAMAKPQDQDEFEEQAAAAEANSGYEHTRDADVEDQREFRPIPVGTACIFDVVGFELNTKKNPYIFAKLAVQSPEEYADGSSDFGIRMSLNPVIGTKEDGSSKKGSGWTFTRDRLVWMYAAINQCTAVEAKKALLDPVYADFPTIGPDEVPLFREALVAQCNATMKGLSFPATAGEEPVQYETDANGQVVLENGEPKVKYRAKATIGKFSYPKGDKK